MAIRTLIFGVGCDDPYGDCDDVGNCNGDTDCGDDCEYAIAMTLSEANDSDGVAMSLRVVG